MFNHSEFNKFIINHNIIGFFEQPIKLVSGRTSHWYVSWRQVFNDPYLLEKVAEWVVFYIRENKIDIECLYGVPEGATKLAVVSSLKLAQKSGNYHQGSHVIPMGRAKPKEHGNPTDRFFVGTPRGKTLVIEDTVTTGGSLMESIDKLREVGIQVTAVLILVNRMERRDDGKTVEEAIAERYNGEVKFYTISSALELLPEIAAKQRPSVQIRESVEREFQLYGVKPIRLT